MPGLKLEVETLAFPCALSATGPASTVAPFLNVTVPDVTGLPRWVTVALKVTFWFRLDGLWFDTRRMLVDALPTTSVRLSVLVPYVSVPL